MNKRQKLLSWVLTVVMLLSLVTASPMTANAEESYDAVINVVDGTGTGSGWTFTSGEIWINENGSYLISGAGIQTSNRIRVTTGVSASVTLDNVNIAVHLPFEVGGTANVTMILKDDSNNTFTSSAGHAGIRVQPLATLTVATTGQPLGNGMLTAIGSSDSLSHWATAGIGGSELEPSGTIIIDGGIITARGGNGSRSAGGAPGIGGAAHRACGNITINGGTITAIGGSTGFGGIGIGGGSSDPANTGGAITINGGTIKAYSGIAGDSGPGIGYCNTIAINDSAYVEAYSSGTIPAIDGITAAIGHNAYLLNFMLNSPIEADAYLNVINLIDDSESITLELKKDYKNFATIVSGANTYRSELADGSKYVANASDDSRDFIGILTDPSTSIGSISVKLVDVPAPHASNVAITGSPVTGETLIGEYDFNGTSESGTTYRWLADSGDESDVFNTMNIAGVNNNPTVPAEFVLSETTLISRIQTYHWNHGSGAVPGTISLQEADGTLYGPWDAVGIAGNLYWQVQPYVELPAGTYTVIDSSNETWANNHESGYRGMTIVSKKTYSDNFTTISGAVDQSYLLTSDDLGKMIKFEVTVRDSVGLTGAPVTSSSVGPVTMPVAPDAVCRIYGNNRYDTAVAVSKAGWPGGADTVLLARGDEYADALAGVPLAHQLGAPILLTQSHILTADTRNEILRLGAKRVIILGGTSAISDAVESALLLDTGLDVTAVERMAGNNRFDTAHTIALCLMAEQGVDTIDTAVVAYGLNFPDALAAASYAAIHGYPILLTQTSQVPTETNGALTALGVENVIVVGGSSVISEAVLTELATRGSALRISGLSRYDTAVAIANHFHTGAKHIYIATGTDFPDAITGAVLAAKTNSGILLVQGNLPEPNLVVKGFLDDNGISAVTLFGGVVAVSDEMEFWFEGRFSVR